jgi:NAD(P)H-nitrite reductase large subunit
MNNITHIENFIFPYKQNKSEIKKINKSETNIEFKDYMRKAQKICHCFSINENDICKYGSLDELIKKTGASTRCTSCLKDLKKHFN